MVIAFLKILTLLKEHKIKTKKKKKTSENPLHLSNHVWVIAHACSTYIIQNCFIFNVNNSLKILLSDSLIPGRP